MRRGAKKKKKTQGGGHENKQTAGRELRGGVNAHYREILAKKAENIT
jgi:hypothetical protein